MKKILSISCLLLTITLAVCSCKQAAGTNAKGISSRFLTVPADQSYLTTCGVEFCFCEHAKQHFSYPVAR